MAFPTPLVTDVRVAHAAQDGRDLRTRPIATSTTPEQCHPGFSSRSGHTGLLLFLDTHLEHGRLDTGSYGMLHAVLQMFSEISLLLFPHSHVLEARVMRRIATLSRSIIDTFHSFGEHIDAQLGRARRAMAELPELAVSHEKTRQRNLKIWRRRLRTLHEPSSNDVNMYRHFLTYFDSQVHAPFLQLHRVEPRHNSWHLRHSLNHIRDCLVSLQDNVEEANKIVTNLDTEFTFGSWETDDGLEDVDEKKATLPLEMGDERLRARPAPSRSTNDMLASLDDFFDGLEFLINDDGSPTDMRREYGIAPGSSGTDSTTPRVFTRSFDELEESVKDLRLHRLDLTDGDPDADKAVKVKDFALPTPCLLPSPATLLERREALCAREPTWEHRVIGGQVVQSRRPHDRNRAQTVDERGGGLDAWLAESPSPGRAMERVSSVHSRVLHRQQTL